MTNKQIIFFSMKNIFLTAVLLLCAVLTGFAQSRYTIKGSIVDHETGEALLGATIQLLALPDSTFAVGAVADDMGAYTFRDVQKKNYVMKVSSVGYVTKYVGVNLNRIV